MRNGLNHGINTPLEDYIKRIEIDVRRYAVVQAKLVKKKCPVKFDVPKCKDRPEPKGETYPKNLDQPPTVPN